MATYGHDEKNNRIETMTKQEIYALLAEAIQEGQLPQVDQDTAFVTMFKSIVDGKAYKMAFCTQAQYNELEANDELETDALYIITDDASYDDLVTALNNLSNDIESVAETLSVLNEALIGGDLVVYEAQVATYYIDSQDNTHNIAAAIEIIKTYEHNILIYKGDGTSGGDFKCYLTIMTNDNTLITTISSLKSIIESVQPIKATGFYRDSTNFLAIISFSFNANYETNHYLNLETVPVGGTTAGLVVSDQVTIIDKVR